MLLPLLFLNSALGTLFPPICKRLPGLSPFFFRWTLSCLLYAYLSFQTCFTSPSLFDFFFVASPCTPTTSTHSSVTNNIWCAQTLHTSLALTPWTRVHTLFRPWASHLRLNVSSHSIRSPRSPRSSQSTPLKPGQASGTRHRECPDSFCWPPSDAPSSLTLISSDIQVHQSSGQQVPWNVTINKTGSVEANLMIHLWYGL